VDSPGCEAGDFIAGCHCRGENDNLYVAAISKYESGSCRCDFYNSEVTDRTIYVRAVCLTQDYGGGGDFDGEQPPSFRHGMSLGNSRQEMLDEIDRLKQLQQEFRERIELLERQK
jgi:hypothetical protein